MYGRNYCECRKWYDKHDGPQEGFRRSKMCNPPYPYIDVNTVKDYNMLQNHPDVGQISIRQNINVKHIRVENNSPDDLLIGIEIYYNHDVLPKPKLYLRSGETRDLGVNMPGERTQFLWIFDTNGKLLSSPHTMHNHMNLFSINKGENKFWVMDFRHPGFAAAK